MKGAIFWRSNAKYFSSDYETFTLSSALLNSQHPEGEVPPSALLVFFFDQPCIVKLHHLLQCSATSDSYKPPLDPLQLNLSDPNSLLLLGPLPPRAIPLPCMLHLINFSLLEVSIVLTRQQILTDVQT